MRVLHLGKYAPPFFGGIENFMTDLAESCVNQGLSVAAIVHDHQKPRGLVVDEIAGVKVYRVPCHGQLMFAPISPGFGTYLNQVLAEFKPDVLHIHMPNTSAFFALLYASAKDIPWVVHWHSDVIGEHSPWFLRAFYPLYRPFERAVLKRAAKVIVTSPPYLLTSRALQPFEQKCKVINLGVKTPQGADDIKPVAQDLIQDQLQLLMVGRLTYYKGHRLMIDALAQLKRQGLKNIQLNIVGTGELEPLLVSQIKQLELNAQVKMLGKLSQEQLTEQFVQADCLCLPSLERTEAFGVVLLEAASFGLPAIVSDVPGSGMSWVVQDGKTGLVVKRGNADAIAVAIKTLLQQPKKRAEMGEAAKVRFEQLFKIERVAKATVSLYHGLKNARTE
jgi:rhamnosyl/mannosyltransferase